MVRSRLVPGWLLFALLPGTAFAQPERSDQHGDALPPGALARLGSTRLRHADTVTTVTYSPRGGLLATAGRDAAVRIWDASTGRQIHRFQQPGREYYALAFSPDGRTLAAGTGEPGRPASNPVLLWDVASGQEVTRLGGHRQPAHTVTFSADGQTLLSVSGDDVIRWDVGTWQRRSLWRHPSTVAAVAASPDGLLLATAGTESGDTLVRVWDAGSGAELLRLRGHKHGVSHLNFSADGRYLASANAFDPIRLWDPRTGRLVKRLAQSRQGGMAPVFSPDGKVLAAGAMDGSVCRWDVNSGEELPLLSGYRGWINALAFSPDGGVLALAGADSPAVYRWETASRNPLPRGGHDGPVLVVAYAPDGRLLASGGGDRQGGRSAVRLWNPATGEEVACLEGPTGRVQAIAFSPDGALLAAGGDCEECVRLWDVARRTEAGRLSPGSDGRRAAPPDRRVSAVAFSPDGNLLGAAIDDGDVRVWNIESRTETLRLRGHGGCVTALAFAPDGKTLATCSVDRTARLWEVTTGRELWRVTRSDDTFKSVAFSPDGKLVAAGGGDWQWEVKIIEAATGRPVGRAGGGPGVARQVAFAPDGRVLAVAAAGRPLALWEVATRQERRELPGHTGAVCAVAFSPDGRALVSAGADTTLLVWDLVTPRGGNTQPLTDAALRELWDHLGCDDARRADEAIRRLASAPREAVALLRSRLAPPPPLSPQEVEQMLADLDHPRYPVRDRATTALARLGELAAPLLRQRLAGPASPEAARRARLLLDRIEVGAPPAGCLRTLRAVEVLERIGTADARRLLQEQAAGGESAAAEARASLERLTQPRP